MNNKFSDYYFSARNSSDLLISQARQIDNLIKNQLFSCVAQCNSSEDQSYYRKREDLKCEKTCIDVYNSNVTRLQLSEIERFKSQACLVKCTSSVGEDYVNAGICSERCYVSLRESVFSILKDAVPKLKSRRFK